MKNTKTCPKCQGTEIYTNAGQTKRGDNSSLPVSSWVSLSIAVYICSDCGYMEQYIESGDLKDTKKMQKLQQEFKKL